MSLLNALNVGVNALMVNQLGLRVTGNNIANANTPGYAREELIVGTAPSQQLGDLHIGLGARVLSIEQQIDTFVVQRLREAKSDVASGEAQQDIFLELESLFGELTDSDLSTTISQFFGSIHDVVNQPETAALRNVTVLEGERLSALIRNLDGQLRETRIRVNDYVKNSVGTINDLLADIAQLNQRIVSLEGGGEGASSANALRSQRAQLIDQVSELISVRVHEQQDGAVTITSGGDYLVDHAESRELVGVTRPDGDLNVTDVLIADNQAPISLSSGRLEGWIVARDEIVVGFRDRLNQLARTLIGEFNRQHSQGQGLSGLTEVISDNAVDDVDAALDAAGLPFAVEHGTLSIRVQNTVDDSVTLHDLAIQLEGLPTDTTSESLRAALDAIDGITATLTPGGRLQIESESEGMEFSFAGDTSGVLAALGLNTFFSGSTASDIGIRQAVKDDPSQFAVSKGGPGNDSDNGLLLAALSDSPLEMLSGQSLNQLYEAWASETAQGSANTSAILHGYRVYAGTLESQHLSISGVNLDEEALKLITYQRAYQAVARYVQAVSEILEVLVSL